MEGSCILSVLGFILLLHSSSCKGSQNHNEELFNSFDVLTKVATSLIRNEDFPELYRNAPLRKAVRPICPLIDKHNEIKQHILSGNAKNITELKAAEIVLGYVLNDTCQWIRSIPGMTNFTCSTNQLTELELLCIEITIRDIALEQRTHLYNIYRHEDKVARTYSQAHQKEWISNTFSGKDIETIDKVLTVIKKYPPYKKCGRNQQTVSC